MNKAWLLVATLSVPTVAGCTGGTGSGGDSKFKFWERNEQGLTAPSISTAPKNEIAPQRGEVLERSAEMPKSEPPGRMARLTAAVKGSSAVKSMTSVFHKKNVPTRGIEVEDTTSREPKPAGAKFYIELAQLQEQNGNLVNAAGQYQSALKLEPKSLDALMGLARLEDRQGNLEAAAGLYRRAAKAHPQQAVVHNDLGLCLARMKKPSEAVESLTHAVQLQPKRELYRNNLAKLLVDVGQYDKAWEQLAAVHGPAKAHYNLGYLLHQGGNDAAAAHHFGQALKFDPAMVEAKQWLDALAPETPPATNGAPATSAPWPTADREVQRPAAPAGVLPMVLRPESDPAREPRYGMEPGGYAPPRRY